MGVNFGQVKVFPLTDQRAHAASTQLISSDSHSQHGKKSALNGNSVNANKDSHAQSAPQIAARNKAATVTIPSGSSEATRRAFNKRFLLDLAEDCRADEVIE